MSKSKLPRRSSSSKKSVDTSKVAKLLRLMLSSDQPGEVVAAGAALRRALAQAKMDLHDLVDAVTIGLRPPAPPPPERRSLAPPPPNLDDWQAMCWWLHWYRQQLRNDQRERVADYLLGQAFYDTDGRCMAWHLDELRALVARVRAAEVA